jgi:hypothetical protein
VEVSRQVLWLHTLGERHHADVAGWPQGRRVLAERSGIRNPKPMTGMPFREAGDISCHPPSQTAARRERQRLASATRRVGISTSAPCVRHWLNYRTAEHRRILRRGEFSSSQDLSDKIENFIKVYDRTAKPFRWTYDGSPLKAA